MADFFFFTEVNKLNDQVISDKAFGSLLDDASGFDRFSTTSLHTASSNPKAISCCAGDVFIVSDSSRPATHVNLLIRPSEQPSINLPKIKFIVYRGLLRSSLITDGDIASPAFNDLTKIIWEAKQKEDNDAGLPASPPNANSLEVIIDAIHPANTPLLSLFVDPAVGGAIDHPVIKKGGLHIGDFDSTEFGIEFIIDEIGYEPDLNYLSLRQNIISVAQLPVGFNQAQYFSHWNDKERILFFLDPCAVFGSFCESSSPIKAFIDNVPTPVLPVDIYSTILQPIFFNRNKIYLDIRNELNYSYNYFKNYTNLSIGGVSQSLYLNCGTPNQSTDSYNPVDYNSFASNWPILIIENNNFASNPAVVISERLLFEISFPKCGNVNTTLVVKQGPIQEPKIRRDLRLTGNYRHILFPNNGNKSEPVTFHLPNAAIDQIRLISSYVRLSYCKQAFQSYDLNNQLVNTEFQSWFDLDNVFTPFDMFQPWGATPPNPALGITDSWVYKNECYTDVIRTSAQLFLGNSGIARDSVGNITLFSFSVNKLRGNQNVNELPFSLVGSKANVGNASFIRRNANQFGLAGIQILHPVTGTPIEFFGELNPNVINNFGEYNPSDFAFVTFSQADWATLQSYLDGTHPAFPIPPFLPGYKVHIGFNYLNSVTADNVPPGFYSDAGGLESIDILNFQVVLRGFGNPPNPVGGGTNPNIISAIEIPTTVNHYRIRKNVLYSMLAQDTLSNVSITDNSLRMPTILGTGYTVTELGDNVTIQPDPLGPRIGDINLATTNVKSRALSCNLYLFRGDGITPEEFSAIKIYIESNIQEVWNSQSNLGLGAVYDPTMPTITGDESPTNIGATVTTLAVKGGVVRDYWIDASDVHVLEASNRHFDQLDQNEVLWLIDSPNFNGAFGNSRSFVSGNRRVGVIFYTAPRILVGMPIIPYADPNPNTPAHEFGHVLGLKDRYSTWANVLSSGNNSNQDNNNNLNSSLGRDEAVARGGKTSIYLEESVDDQYTTRYSWVHNLMSTMVNVGVLPGVSNNRIFGELNYNSYMYPYDLTFNNPINNPKITIFLSKNQLDIVTQKRVENEFPDRCFFRDTYVDSNIDNLGGRLIFVGIYDDNDKLVSDFQYNPLWYVFNSSDDKMSGRIRTNSNPNTTSINFANTGFSGWFTPYEGITSLTTNEPVYFDPFPSFNRQSALNRDISEIETGGNSFNSLGQWGINSFHLYHCALVDLIALTNRYTSTPASAGILVPAGVAASYTVNIHRNASNNSISTQVLINAGLINNTNDLNILQQVIRAINTNPTYTFSNDQFSNIGMSDEAGQGREYWNLNYPNDNGTKYSRENNGNVDNSVGQRTAHIDFANFHRIYTTPPPTSNPLISSAPFAYRRYDPIDTYALDNALKAIFKRNDITWNSTYNLITNFFYNRRRIIELIQSGV